MFDDIFSDLFSNDSGGGGLWGGNEDAAGITGLMGMAPPTYGDYSGPQVFDQQFPEAWSGEYSGTNPYDFTSSLDGATAPSAWSSLLSSLGGGKGIAQILGSGLSLGSGLNALGQARQLGQQAAAADPMAPYRSGWAARLNALLADPSSITSEPGYAAGLEAVKRGGAAAGFFNSGNMVGDLTQFGTDFYDRAVNRLGRLVGGTPGGGLPATQSSINLTNAGLNRISSGISSMATGLFDQ